MIYTLGCSFTKWFWHTWGDWLEEYSTEPVTNLAWPGLSNEVIYWELMSRKNQITKDDTVMVMLTGSNRISIWYDDEWIENNDCRGFFPDNKNLLEFGQTPWRGMYRLHPDRDVSVTHMIVDNFNIIYQIQQLLQDIGCKYRMMFWQNPWYDVRPKVEPTWTFVWNLKQQLSKQEQQLAKEILQLTPMKNLIKSIDWTAFYLAPTDSLDPSTYTGMWEYKNQKQLNKDYMQYVHEDPHPDAVIHHDFLVEVLLGKTLEDNDIRQQAKKFALDSIKHKINMPRSMLIPGNYENKIQKLYENTVDK
jgi:hypothetical protein